MGPGSRDGQQSPAQVSGRLLRVTVGRPRSEHGRVSVNRLSGWVLRHRLLVVLVWLAVAVAGGAERRLDTVDRLSYEFALPGQPAYEANQLIRDRFGGGGDDDPLLLVVRGDERSRRAAQAARRRLQSGGARHAGRSPRPTRVPRT